MCSEGVAKIFRKTYPVIGVLSTIACLYAVSVSPPLYAELFTTTVNPVNGTIQIVECTSVPIYHCARVVDKQKSMDVTVYHVSMGVPFLLCCIVGTIFYVLTKKEDNNIINADLSFAPESYQPVTNGDGTSLYTWELIFWGYVLLVHTVLVTALTSPVDIFDTAISVLFTTLCLMFLCRPRSGNTGGGVQVAVVSTLLVCTWLTFTSIPHVYEPDRLWLLVILVLLDTLLLLVHMYDGIPTMYTIVMGRLTFISLVNLSLAYAFTTLKDRLDTYHVLDNGVS
jgi:hypothetical protein